MPPPPPPLNENEFAKAYGECHVVCKQADFGLSRSLDLQTKSFFMSKTESVSRGIPAYMAPELHFHRLFQASQEYLKKADMWSLGLHCTLLNPNLRSPYRAELETHTNVYLITVIGLFFIMCVNTTSPCIFWLAFFGIKYVIHHILEKTCTE